MRKIEHLARIRIPPYGTGAVVGNLARVAHIRVRGDIHVIIDVSGVSMGVEKQSPIARQNRRGLVAVGVENHGWVAFAVTWWQIIDIPPRRNVSGIQDESADAVPASRP